ncbi:hypothetical protein CGLO_08596 [Colletotrichum gloeosporioides Cg-14]|uniref:Uncharacterized protein n=1 Tax=Colletotrichum gloeosporioides (strain Cg-14) TaxID=1237896 RepID=T0LJK4_COLGC|nr:hypothetical protein CGLO_08596 [Colletotrichum gloeosporioides Cg-14]
MSDGSRLRNHIDLTFLSESKSKKILTEGNEYLYEGQSSVCVTGRNTVVWTALCLADTHFDNPDPNNEYLLSFYDSTEDSDSTSLPMDALSVGSRTAINMSGLDPREYFLLVVKFRVQRIKDEWIKILYELKDRTNAYLYDPHIPLRRRKTSLGTAADESQDVERSEAWVKQSSHLLTRLINCIAETIGVWEKFASRDAERLIHGTDDDIAGRIVSTCWDIRELFDEMEKAHTGLKSLKSELENFKTELSMHVAVDGSRAIILQYWNVTVFQLVTPMALAGSMMQAGLTYGNKVACFALMSVAITIITFAIQPALTWYHRKSGHQVCLPMKPKKLDMVMDSDEAVSMKRSGFSLPPFPDFVYKRHSRRSDAGMNEV